ncbi:MAG: phospholipid carrier-dependent glycosyltransferase, partial [Synechococcales cyanobacterium RM1_1_8]|nr:phospholipid carrier-dependent glycosyltransferase [Synechococcales cyanobacterium RM1_1_8]
TTPRPPAITWAWPLVFILGAYLLASLNPNKDARYALPYLPAIALFLAWGITLYPARLRWLPQGAIALSALLLLNSLFPLPLGASTQAALQHLGGGPPDGPQRGGLDWPQAALVQTMIQAEPHLQNTLGVLPSTPSINQHNVSFFGAQQDFRVFGRQVGVREDQVGQDGRSLNWFLTKTGDQGSIPPSQPSMTQAVEGSPGFALAGQWRFPEGGELKLYHRRQPWITVEPFSPGPAGPGQPAPPGLASVRLLEVSLPDRAPPNQPLGITYRWVGPVSALQNSVAVITWERVAADLASPPAKPPANPNANPGSAIAADSAQADTVKANPATAQTSNPAAAQSTWFHDHTPGLGFLRSAPGSPGDAAVTLTERLAMLPAAPPGQYRLRVTLLDRRTGKQQPLESPALTLRLEANAPAQGGPELDWVTQLRLWAKLMPLGPDAIGPAFEEVARVNQYDPRQDYLHQAEVALRHRLAAPLADLALEKELRYALVLAEVLQQDVAGAIAALTPLTVLDQSNPYVHAYLSFVNLYGLQPRAAQQALEPALNLAPELEVVQILDGVASLMGGKLIQAFQVARRLLAQP